MKILVTRLDLVYAAFDPAKKSAAIDWAVRTESSNWLECKKAYRYLVEVDPCDAYVVLSTSELDGLNKLVEWVSCYLTEGEGRMPLDDKRVVEYLKLCCLN